MSFSLNAAPLYHWLDEQGYPVYSDLPKGVSRTQQQPQLESHALQEPQPYVELRSTEAQPATEYSYKSLRLKSYHTEQERQRIIRVQITPALHKPHKVALYLNQKLYQSALHSQSFLLHQLPKGRHKLVAVIKDDLNRSLFVSPALHLEIQN